MSLRDVTFLLGFFYPGNLNPQLAMVESTTAAESNFEVTSSVAEDVWHGRVTPGSYEWWYFDALSDDARDGVVIIFLDNFIFSPRYNSSGTSENRFPAIAFTYYHDGKPLYRAINEFTSTDFATEPLAPSCRIGKNIFQIEATPYGIRYKLSVEARMRGGRELKASFEWLLVESDFTPDKKVVTADHHSWNLVAPRCDVSGKVEVFDNQGKLKDQRQFRGTGYHDHNLDSRRMPETIDSWQWGRVHFSDASAVFYRYHELGSEDVVTRLFVVRDGELSTYDTGFVDSKYSRDVFGLKYPKVMSFEADNDVTLTVDQVKTIDSSFFYLRFLSEMKLKLPDGSSRSAIGFSEHLSPHTLGNRWLGWLIDMRIGRNGKGAFLP